VVISIEFLSEHPGGAQVILKLAEQDASKEYDTIHNPELVEETLPPSTFLGSVGPKTIAQPVKGKADSSLRTQKKNAYPPLTSIINLGDFEVVAKKYLSPTGWAYYSSAADDEYSKQ
jgi:L-lactate dehydrogenase (cytochrome)